MLSWNLSENFILLSALSAAVWIIAYFEPEKTIYIFLAKTQSAHGVASRQGKVNIEVVSASGSVIQTIQYREFWQGGTHIIKKYLETRKGEHYGIIIRNMTPERVDVIISVDGRNIICWKNGGRLLAK